MVKVTDFGMSRIVPEKVQNLEFGLAGDGKQDGDITDVLNVVTATQRTQSDEQSISSTSVDTLGQLSISRSSLGPNKTNRHSHFNPEMTSNLGTTAWCAPELLTASNKTRYSIKVRLAIFYNR